MPRVLLIINRFNLGGPVFNAVFLAKYIREHGFETLLVGGVPDKDEASAYHIAEEYGVEIMVLEELQRTPNYFLDKKAYRKLKTIIEEFKPDIVHTHASKAGALGRKAAFQLNVPVVLHTFHGHVFHSYFGKIKTAIYQRIERQLAKKSDGIIAISEGQKHELSEVYAICPATKISVIPLGFDLDKFSSNRGENRIRTRQEYGIEKHEVAIAMTGRLAPIKNHLFFLRVLETILRQEKLPIRVFIVGDGSERAIIEPKVRELNATFGEICVMTSWIHEIATFTAGMDIVALSSKNEGTPMSIIEAQAAEVAVISSDAGGIRDVMLDGETGYVIPQNELNLYVEKLTFLIKNKEIRQKMSQKGISYVQERFGIKTLAENTVRFYQELLNNKTTN